MSALQPGRPRLDAAAGAMRDAEWELVDMIDRLHSAEFHTDTNKQGAALAFMQSVISMLSTAKGLLHEAADLLYREEEGQ